MARTPKPDAETTAVLVALRRIVRFLRLADRDAEAACGVSAAQLFVLSTLASSPSLSLAELAGRTLTDQSSVSTVVGRLVERGLVVRKVSSADRRRAELRLTPAGRNVLATAPRVPQDQIITAVGALPVTQRRHLSASLDALVEIMGATGVAPRMLFEDEVVTRPARRPRARPRTSPRSSGRRT